MTLIFDTSVLSCFSRADKLQVLDLLTRGEGRRVTTHAVLHELRQGIPTHPKLALAEEQRWIAPVAVDGLEELKRFAEFSRRLVDHQNRNVGEASALAWAKVHGCVFLSDDQTALLIADEYNIRRRRTLAIIANGVRSNLLSQPEAGALVDDLIGGGAHFPCRGGSEFLSWANREGLLDRNP